MGLKLNLSGSGGQLSIFLGNKGGELLQGLVCTVPPSPAFALQLGATPAVLEPKKQVGGAVVEQERVVGVQDRTGSRDGQAA